MLNAPYTQRQKLLESLNNNLEVVKAWELMVSAVNRIPADMLTTANTVNSTTTFADIPGLRYELEPFGIYEIVGQLLVQSAATTTGLAVTATVPAGATISGTFSHPVAANTLNIGYVTASGNASNDTTGFPAISTTYLVEFRALVVNGGTVGNVQLRFRSEVAASAITVLTNSSLSVRRLK